MRILSALTLLLSFALPSASRADASADADAAAHAYALEVPTELKLKVGETKPLRIAVVPNAGSHVSPEAPVSLKATAATSFDLPRAKLAREDSKPTAAQGIEFALPVLGKTKGPSELAATLSFYICVANLCAHQKRELNIHVQVE